MGKALAPAFAGTSQVHTLPQVRRSTCARAALGAGAARARCEPLLPDGAAPSAAPNLGATASGTAVRRRSLIGLALTLYPSVLGARPEPAGALELTPLSPSADDDVASRVYEDATRSVAAVLLLKSDPRSGEEARDGTGSGIVWDKFGHIVTNYHVIAKVLDEKARVRCAVSLLEDSGKMVQLDASVIGIDPSKDLAVLKVVATPEELSPATMGSSADLRVGQSCFAVGNPYGYLHTLTSGVVSGLRRAIPSPSGQAIPGAIQTDAAINSGNSGGPLLDSSGHVIGINTATFTRSGSGVSSGVNFAVPVDTVVRVVPQLIVYGTPTRYVNAMKR